MTTTRPSRHRVRAALLLVVLVGTAVGATVSAGSAGAAAPMWRGNGKIVFSSNRAQTGWQITNELYTVNADGSEMTRLTFTHAIEYHPAWSSDGTQIAYARDGAIWVMAADGSGQAVLVDTPGRDQDPAWSPDGEKIAFTAVTSCGSFCSAFDIWIADADGSDPTRITTTSASENAPTWSPDGTRIAYWRGGEVWVMNADGTGHAPLPQQWTTQRDPDWSPLGQEIVFRANVRDHFNPQHDIVVMNADGTGATVLTNSVDRNESEPTWSPAGDMIVYRCSPYGTVESYLCTMNADGTGQAMITAPDPTRSSVQDSDPDWQPILDTSAPTIDLQAPDDGATYELDEDVPAEYACADEAGGSGVASCDGDVPSGQPIDTRTVGTKTFTVTARDHAGNTRVLSHTYRVCRVHRSFELPGSSEPLLLELVCE